MKDINTLIDEYWSGKLSASEKQLLLELLDEKVTDFSDEEYHLYTHLVNENQTLLNKENAGLNKLLESIETKLEFEWDKAPVRSIYSAQRWKWIAAASIIFVIAGAAWYAVFQQSDNKPAEQQFIVSEILFSNNSNTVKDTVLPDGSIIRLYPQTTIRFENGFKEKERGIKLNGKALFKVAKDTSRPFIVYAGGFSTKALGTQFEINTNEKGKFSVKLFEGKVVIKTHEKRKTPFNDVYLTPGEELVYDIQNQRIISASKNEIAVNKNKADINKDDHEDLKNKPVLAFNKLPLQVVFKQLEEEFSIIIIYDTEKIADKEFSGNFEKKNTAMNVLKSICKEYGWKVKFENGAYVIE